MISSSWLRTLGLNASLWSATLCKGNQNGETWYMYFTAILQRLNNSWGDLAILYSTIWHVSRVNTKKRKRLFSLFSINCTVTPSSWNVFCDEIDNSRVKIFVLKTLDCKQTALLLKYFPFFLTCLIVAAWFNFKYNN